MREPETKSLRSSRGLIVRLLHIMLDVKPRWSLALWVWLPIGGLVIIFSLAAQNRNGMSGASVGTTFWIGSTDDGGYRIVDSPSNSLVTVEVRFEYDIRPTRWVATMSTRVTGIRGVSQSEADRAATATLGDAFTRAQRLFLYVQPEVAQPWVMETWRELAKTGGGTRAGHPSLPMLALYHSSTVVRWLAIAGISVSLLHWLLSGMQVGAYKRMLRRHESGHCPHCNYDIAAHPDAVCPECGCDHRSRRREAIEQLRRAKQWPVQRPVTPEA